MNIFIQIFTNPTDAFVKIKESPHWKNIAIPIILIVFSGAIFQLLPASQRLIEEKKAQVFEEQIDRIYNMDMPQEQKEEIILKMEEQMESWESPWRQYVLGPIFLFLMMAILAGFLLFGGNFIFGGKASFFQNLNIVGLSMMVMFVATLFRLPVMLAAGTLDINFSLSIFTFGLDEESFLPMFLQKFDFFHIWIAWLMSVGFSVNYMLDMKRSYGYIFGSWAVLNLLFTLVGRFLMSFAG